MSYTFATVALGAFGILLWYWWHRRSIAHLLGPPSESWFVGNNPSFERADEATEAQFAWTKKYGNAFRVKGCFGEDILFLADPKAMQYILNTSRYDFPKTWEGRVATALITGRGLAAVDGAQHARQRRIINASFSQSVLKGYLSLFFELSRKTTAAWTTMIRKQSVEASILDVSRLLSRTTLDAIGEAAFGYKFNSIENVEPETELQKAYRNLLVDVNYMVSDFNIMFRRLLGYVPFWVADILTSLPKKDLRRIKNYMAIARGIAKDLLKEQMGAHKNSQEGGKDLISICIKANNSEDPKRRLDDDEIIPQITTMLLGGHDTTASSFSWVLYELSKNPEVQSKLREEVKNTWAIVTSRGESEMAISDLDSMTYTIAVLKETLRFHPVIPHIVRRAGHDDVIPLDSPQKTVSGHTITAIPVREGQIVQLGLASYNRLKSIWGQDADEWRPERFLAELPSKHKTNLGIFGNLSTFSSGLRGCIGWRFAVLEMQIILIELIGNFEFSPAPNIEIKRVFSVMMQSMVKGEEHKGTQMPLNVAITPHHNGE